MKKKKILIFVIMSLGVLIQVCQADVINEKTTNLQPLLKHIIIYFKAYT